MTDPVGRLTEQIEALESELLALQPEWDVPGLRESYLKAQVSAALRDLYDAA